MSPKNPGNNPIDQVIQCDATEGFFHWMKQANGVLAITTYQAGKVVMVGCDGRQVTVLPRNLDRPMGLSFDGRKLAIATRYEVVIFTNATQLAHDYLEEQPGRYDSLFLPTVTYHTTDLGVHDIAFGSDGLWLVATRYSCLATHSAEFHLDPRWHPPFITEVCPEDRCHLNGLALSHGRPKYVTALGQSDVVGGWRETRADGGLIIDVASSEVVAHGLSMPHSPRIYDDRLWVLNSGAGELLQIDPLTGLREVICVLPGYLRGLCFFQRYALVGLSLIREKHLFGGLPVQERFPRLVCGAAVVDITTGQMVGLFQFTGGCTELYDVLFLIGFSRPMILNYNHEAARSAVMARGFSYWLRPSSLRSEGTPAT